ncbi:hypothetical protein HPB50_001575 [Hyalomma asiaticum]|uniref:Uncharacterized protein n=1 Tax=Hyalomma asiaticum TaxID=266040 RepID=A0ACB7SLS8_HYAAI|nr:hypothetical protein HPB50_001575 [Hyalomma asiaticum]
MEGPSGGITFIPHRAAKRHNATMTGGEEWEMNMCCSEVPTTTGSRSPPHTEDAEDHAQVPERPWPGAGKANVIKEMVTKMTDKTGRVFKMLLTRLNKSDAQQTRDIGACTLVKKRMAFIKHELEIDKELDVDHILIKVVLSR